MTLKKIVVFYEKLPLKNVHQQFFKIHRYVSFKISQWRLVPDNGTKRLSGSWSNMLNVCCAMYIHVYDKHDLEVYGRLPYTRHSNILLCWMYEMLYLMFTIHNDNIHTIKHMLYWRSNMLSWRFTHFQNMLCVSNFLTIVLLVVHTYII